jgi:Zn-dependent metalloprotease
MGRTVISTTQTFNGVRVYGTDQNFHINDNGVIECVAGSKVDDIENKVISKSFSAKYSQKDVLNAVEKDLGFKPDYDEAPKPEIILYPVGSKYDYVYEVKVKCVSPYYVSCTYYVNAYNLSIIKVNNNICSVEQPPPNRYRTTPYQ